MEQPEKKNDQVMAARFALVGIFVTRHEDPNEAVRPFEEVDREAITRLEEELSRIFFREGTQVWLYPVVVPAEYAPTAADEFERLFREEEPQN
jgi:FAD/FMN-containing dehydrogenase